RKNWTTARTTAVCRGHEGNRMQVNSTLEATIENGWARRNAPLDADDRAALIAAVERAIGLLDSGEARVAEKRDGRWQVNEWLKKAVLLSFKLQESRHIPGTHSNFFDKVPLKYAGYSEDDFR